MSTVEVEQAGPMTRGAEPSRIVSGWIAGLVGGAVACWVMDRFEAIRRAHDDEDVSAGAEFIEAYPAREEAEEESTIKVARTISRRVFRRELPEELKERAGLAVHYAFGTTLGGFYGALSEMAPGLARGFGLPFGTAVWLAANEIAVPALRLGKPPRKVPLSEHAFSLATHFVYGLTTDGVRRLIRLATTRGFRREARARA